MTRSHATAKVAGVLLPRFCGEPKIGGHRVSLDIYHCGGPLNDHPACEVRLRELIAENDLTVREIYVHPWPNDSYIMLAVLEDSFILIETWPDPNERHVKVIVDLCHFRRHNTARAEKIAQGIMDLFFVPGAQLAYHSSIHGP